MPCQSTASPAARRARGLAWGIILAIGAGLLAPLEAVEPPKTEPRNRLATETSPYLRLHAHNPVDWYPWGPEALAKAKAEGKLIFLSSGYASCHWCHVMERESFMDDEIAAYLNKHFVCIKVDREERPDVDEIYMTAVQILSRRGGWPLSMFLTPDAQPFYGGTYFPPRDRELELPPGTEPADGKRPRMVGFLTLIHSVQQKWEEAPDEVRAGGEQLAGYVRRALERRTLVAPSPLTPRLIDDVHEALAQQYDAQHGGFGFSEEESQRAKFPEPTNLTFLLDRHRRTKQASALSMALGTLEKMAAGGIRDHVGGGFHRYSVDRFWRIPHFEKMLVDQGQLASVYAEAYALTGRDDFRRVVVELIECVDRELSSPEGGFYTALDADSDGHEGAFYVWTQEELAKLLNPVELETLAPFGLMEPKNFELGWVLVRRGPATAAEAERFEPIRRRLLEARGKRPRPLTDDKILTSANGLMIAGLADAGRLLKEPAYLRRAERAAEFVLTRLRTPEGRLLRTFGRGEARLNAYVEDYAYLVDGLLALYRATNERRWLDEADQLTRRQIELFWDPTGHGFYFTSNDHESLIARSKSPADSAIPSANAVAAGNLLTLARLLDRPADRDRAQQTIQAFASYMAQAPAAMPRMAQALATLLAYHDDREKSPAVSPPSP